MIRTEALTKFYGSRCAVHQLSMSIEDGQIVGFLGLNGAGKTTTLRMLAGLLAPSSGHIEIDGQTMHADSAHSLRWRIGFLPDKPPVYEDMTVRRYLDFVQKLKGGQGGVKRIDEVIELTSIREYTDTPIAELSHGFQQRVGIAQAVIHNPALVILDEPINGLDPQQIIHMRKLISELRSHHTVLLSSHNLVEVGQTCDQLLLIDEGKLVAQGTLEELQAKFSSAQRLSITLKGESSAADRVSEVARQEGLLSNYSLSSEEDVQELEVTLAAGHEPEEISQRLFEAGLGIRRIQPAKNSLEGIFEKLTEGAPS